MTPRRAAIVILLLISVLGTTQNILGNIVANLLQEALGDYANWVVVPFVVITVTLLAFELRGLLQQQSERRADDLESRNRRAMIQKVRAIWVTGVLQRSLYQETLITLGLAERPDAVERPMDILVQRPDKADQPLPPGKRVVDVYDELGGSLLILGAPASGKTTLLLELARDLLDRAEQEESHPIPVVFPLSTWAEQRLPLTTWLVDELNKRYDVPRKIGQAWVEAEQILPLLDGLDEVKAEHRAACVEAINAFRQDHGLLPLVVCSREKDYKDIGPQFRLQGATVVQPLTHEQVDYYLVGGGTDLAAVRQALRDDPTLWELLDTPLMLNVVTMAYAGQPVAALQQYDTLEERRRHIFEKYVDQMFKRRSSVTRYTAKQTLHWLAWLGKHMVQHSQTAFHIEWMQSDWLSLRRQQRLVTFVTSVMSALIFGLSYGLQVGLRVGLAEGLGFGLVWMLKGGTFGGLFGGLSVGLRSPLVSGLLGGLLGVLIFIGLVGGLGGRLVDWLELGLVFGLLGGLSVMVVGYSKRLEPVEKIRWSWAAARYKWINNLFKSLVVGLVFGFVGGLVGELKNGLIAGLVVGLLGGLVGGLRDGFVMGEIVTKSFPNEGIKRSLQNALVSGLLGGLIFGLLIGLLGRPGGVLFDGLGSGLICGLIFGLRFGGRAYLHHFALRLVAWHNNFAPLNYVRFLDYAAERTLLRQVGGGYMFIHRYLLEYFASLDVGSKVEVESKG
jgi:DNA polymerase III delta prime subunit